MLTLSILDNLFKNNNDQRKLLGFTDNRQDAAMQSGYFNDFIFLLTIRSGLLAALKNNGGVLHEADLCKAVFDAIGFNNDTYETNIEYLQNPCLIGHTKTNAQSTLRFILGYRLIRDIRKGWRFNNPSLIKVLSGIPVNWRLNRLLYIFTKFFCLTISFSLGTIVVFLLYQYPGRLSR